MEFAILHAIQSLRSPELDIAMVFFSHLGDHGLIWIAMAFGLLAFEKTRLIGKVTAMSIIVEIITVTLLLKPLINRVRPCAYETLSDPLVSVCYTDPSFPSGHTAVAFAFASALFFMNRRWGLVALLCAALMGFTRLYMFVHFPSDVAAGAVIGTVIGFICYRLYQRYEALKKQSSKPLES